MVLNITRTEIIYRLGYGWGTELTPEDWGLEVPCGCLVPPTIDSKPVPNVLSKIIQCKWKAYCDTIICSSKKNGLFCTNCCGMCQDGLCTKIPLDEFEYINQEAVWIPLFKFFTLITYCTTWQLLYTVPVTLLYFSMLTFDPAVHRGQLNLRIYLDSSGNVCIYFKYSYSAEN